MKNVRLILLAVVSLIIFQSCSKEGPAGPAGPAGSQGPQGAPGSQGNPGTANVIYSPWFNPVTWTNNGTPSIYSNKAATGVTQAVIDQGVVLAYVKFAEEGGLVRAMPAVTFSGKVIWSYSLSVGNIRFHANTTDAVTNLSAAFNMQFRYVIIPGAVAGGRLSSKPYSLKELQDMTYEQVMTLFNIPENSSNTK